MLDVIFPMESDDAEEHKYNIFANLSLTYAPRSQSLLVGMDQKD